MGEIKQFVPENLVIGILSTSSGSSELAERLESEFGPIDYTSGDVDFSYTTYYDGEMGKGIIRRFYSFERLVDPCQLAGIKILTNSIEDSFRENGLRKINLDPGLLDLNRLILATTKNVGHRIPLSDGIYGEVTLIYMKGGFNRLDWTYPDYASPEYLEILCEIREKYKEKLRSAKKHVN